MTRPGSSTIVCGIMGLWTGSVYLAVSRFCWTLRVGSERKGQWAPTPWRYSFVSVMPAVLWTVTAAAEDENHGMLSLQFGEPSTLRCVIGKLIVGENSAWNHIRSHIKSSIVGC